MFSSQNIIHNSYLVSEQKHKIKYLLILYLSLQRLDLSEHEILFFIPTFSELSYLISSIQITIPLTYNIMRLCSVTPTPPLVTKRICRKKFQKKEITH